MTNPRRRWAAGIAVALAAAAGCSADRPSPDAGPPAPPLPSTTGTPAPSASTAAAGGALKPPVQGLLDRSGEPPRSTHTDAVRAFVVDTTWASLQPERGGPLTRPNDIDRAIERARADGMKLKLRVRAGIHAPEWAKEIGGAPITVYYTPSTEKNAGEEAGTIGRFWLPEFGAAYRDLHVKLAAEYDGVPEVAQVGVTRCGTIFTETYLRNARDDRNIAALLGAGFTREADETCHAEQVQAHDVWRRTRSGVAFNPYQSIQPDGSVRVDVDYTISRMSQCREVLGPRCVIENYSLSDARDEEPGYARMYEEQRRLGPPFAFQTATAAKIGDFEEVLRYAADSGANSVELPRGYQHWSVDVLRGYAERLAANPVS